MHKIIKNLVILLFSWLFINLNLIANDENLVSHLDRLPNELQQKIVSFLYDFNSNVNSSDNIEQLEFGIEQLKHILLVNKILKKNSSEILNKLSKKITIKFSSLNAAVILKTPSAIKNLKKMDINFQLAYFVYCSPVMLKKVDLLLKLGADVNTKDIKGFSVLMNVAISGKKDIVKLLLKHPDIDVNIRDKFDNTVLMHALRTDQETIVKLLLKRSKIDVNARNRFGNTALAQAVRSNQKNMVNLLLTNSDADVNIRDRFGNNILVQASRTVQANIVQLLLKHRKINVNAKNILGNTALICYFRQNRIDIIKLLLEHSKTDVNVKDESGRTILIQAVRFGQQDIVELLLKHYKTNINVNIKDKNGNTALRLAKIFRETQIERQIKSYIQLKKQTNTKTNTCNLV